MMTRAKERYQADTTQAPPTADSGDAINRAALGAAFDELPVSSQQHLCNIFRDSPSSAWSMWETSATGAAATLTRSDFVAVFAVKCA